MTIHFSFSALDSTQVQDIAAKSGIKRGTTRTRIAGSAHQALTPRFAVWGKRKHRFHTNNRRGCRKAASKDANGARAVRPSTRMRHRKAHRRTLTSSTSPRSLEAPCRYRSLGSGSSRTLLQPTCSTSVALLCIVHSDPLTPRGSGLFTKCLRTNVELC